MNEEENKLEHFGSNDKSSTNFDASAVIAQAESDKIAQNESRVEASGDDAIETDGDFAKTFDNPLATASDGDDALAEEKTEAPAAEEKPETPKESVDDIFAKAATELPDLPDSTPVAAKTDTDAPKVDNTDDIMEEKTERENLEDAIEELNQDNDSVSIDELGLDKKADATAAIKKELEAAEVTETEDESAAEEPKSAWKIDVAGKETKASASVSATGATAPIAAEKSEKKKSGIGLKIFAFLAVVLAILGCGSAAYLMFSDGKTELLGRTVVSSKSGSEKDKQTQTPDSEDDGDDAISYPDIDYVSLRKLVGEENLFSPIKIGFDDDGEYIVVIANLATGTDFNKNGVWYKSVEDESPWKELQVNAQPVAPLCHEFSDEQKELMEKFDSLDDDLDDQYIGCLREIE